MGLIQINSLDFCTMEKIKYSIWRKRSQDEIQQRVATALNKNVNFNEQTILGLPASYLDQEVFSHDSNLLKNAPFLTSLVHNPNHIGCHTLGESENYFEGTHQIEKELIEICAVDFLKSKPNSCDGYVASGGTEANIQAIWMYRNFFKNKEKAAQDEICILCSEDSHYSMNKASNLLDISIFQFEVDTNTRLGKKESIDSQIQKAKENGKKHFIVILNMMTTMFGSVDEISPILASLKKQECSFKIHVDGAYGGFYYPFVNKNNELNFENPAISSVTLDAHKMCQAPYGTGILLARKGLINHTGTKATYVQGNDFTLIGSRSGANAIAVWMILSKHGPYKWTEKTFILEKRTSWICKQLDELEVTYYRNPHSNIVTMRANDSLKKISKKFGLVPDNHNNPNWYKIVVMDHVTIEKLELFATELELALVENEQNLAVLV